MDKNIIDSSGRLIPLKYKIPKERIGIEKTLKIKGIISSKSLFSNAFKIFLENLININDELKEDIENFSSRKLTDEKKLETLIEGSIDRVVDQEKKEKIGEKGIKKIKAEILIEFKKMRKKERMEQFNKIKDKSDSMLQLLADFNENRKEDIEVFVIKDFYICKNCGNLISINRFKKTNCPCGETINKIKNVDKGSISLLDDNVEMFFKKDFWLEYGIDYMLQKNSFKTFCGYSFLGSSGVYHEIDNMAQKSSKNKRVACECKNKRLSLKDAIIFNNKIKDLGINNGYLITTSSEKANIDIEIFCDNSNIKIIDSVLEEKEEIENIFKKM